MIVRALLGYHDLNVPWALFLVNVVGFAAYLVVGVVIRATYNAFLGRASRYLREIWSWDWIIVSIRLIVTGALTLYCYAWLKVTLPITRPVSFDAALWELDRALFVGHSPNVLFLDLFSAKWFLSTLDWTYEKIFMGTVRVAIPFFLSFASNRIRLTYAIGNTIIWIAGAWLYFLLPAMGPTYRYPEIWNPIHKLFESSRAQQQALLGNYMNVIKIQAGGNAPVIALLGIAAFPSLHVAFELFVALWLRRFSRVLGGLGYLAVILIFIGSVVTGWHYLVDSLAGIALAVGAFVIPMRLTHLHRWRGKQKRVLRQSS